MKNRNGFTLVEMLVVMGILAVLIGIGLSSFSSSTKTAQKARGQELVSNVATALEAIYQREGVWPRRILANGASDGELDENVSYELAKRNAISLSTNTTHKTSGLDKFGIVTPWAKEAIKAAGTGAQLGTKVRTGGTVKDHILHYAVDTDGDGIVDASVGGTTVHIRGSVAVWCGGMDGKISQYKAGGKTSGGAGQNEGSKSGKLADIYSWTFDQVVK